MKGKKKIIKLSNVTKDYKTETITTHVLKGVTLNVYEGDFIAITGPSGSGKSTLMNIIGLLDTPTSGKYILNDKDTSDYSGDSLSYLRNKEIGFVFQSFNLLLRSTAIENVILPAIYAGMKKAERNDKATSLLTKLGLGQHLNNRPNQLSGGQQQRVAIARALMNGPKIILADEPTGNLDTKSGLDVMNVLKELNREGKTIILITHEADIAAKAHKIIKVVDGEIVS